MPTTTIKQQALEAIAQSMVDDKVCPELAKTATHLVPGEGSPNSEIVFIGEAPGRGEDVAGRPFVGAAGRLLNEMLESIGIAREDVYISNIVKYRPPGNRDPSPSEIEAFWPYLQKQLAVIKPKLIVTLGRHATGLFIPGLSISQEHGRPKRKGGQVYLPLYHPAAALYQGSLKQTLMDDFAKIPQILKLIDQSNNREPKYAQ